MPPIGFVDRSYDTEHKENRAHYCQHRPALIQQGVDNCYDAKVAKPVGDFHKQDTLLFLSKLSASLSAVLARSQPGKICQDIEYHYMIDNIA
jgi:hypothetical protein